MADDLPNVNLGSVGFQLVANSEQLERSLDVLSRFGGLVTRATQSINEETAAWARQQVQIEKTLSSFMAQVERANTRAKALGQEGSSAIKDLNTTFERLNQTMTRGDLFRPEEMSRGFGGMAAAVARVNQELEQTKQQLRLVKQQDDALFSAQRRTTSMIGGFAARGAPQQFTDQARAAMAQFEAQVKSGTLTEEQFIAAQRQLTVALDRVALSFREQAATVGAADKALLSYSRQAQAVQQLNARASRMGIDSSFMGANTAALAQYQAALRGGGTQQQVAALLALQTAMHGTRDAISQATRAGSSLSNFMYDFNKATILAAGPLSGFGARVAVMASLLDTGTAKMAFFIAGTVGLGAAFTILGVHAVKASMEMEKFNALLTSSTGATALTGEEYEYLLGQANRLGQSIAGLVQPYSQFATAARLSGMSLEKQRGIFEGVMVAGTALRWGTEQTGRAFLALEQMISKGQVQMQEMKLQLGQVLPGAMELASAAMGKTTGEFLKMMEAGEVLPNELLPKLANLLQKVFGAGALEGARTLQSEFARLSTAVFTFNLALDKQVELSTAVRSVVISLTDAINSLAINMRSVVTIATTAMGALGGLGIAAALTPMFLALGKAAEWAKLALAGLAAIPGWGTLFRIAGAIGGAALAFQAFGEKADEAFKLMATSYEDFNKKTTDWLQSYEEIGFVHKRTYEQMLGRTRQMVIAIDEQILATTNLLQLQLQQDQKAAAGKKPLVPFSAAGLSLWQSPTPTGPSPEVLALQKEQERLQAISDAAKANIAAMLAIPPDKLWNPQAGGAEKTKGKDAWESFLDTIRKIVESGTKWEEKLRAITTQDEKTAQQTIDMAEAWEKTANVLERMNNLKFTDKNALKNVLQEADLWTGDLTSSLQALHLWIQNSETAFKNFQAVLKEQKTASKDVGEEFSKMWTKLQAAKDTFAGKNVEDLKSQEQLAEHLRKIHGWLTTIGADQETINTLVARYTEMWQEERGIEKDTKKIEQLQKALDQVAMSVGLARERAWRDYFRSMETIAQAQAGVAGKQLIDADTANQYRLHVSTVLYEKLWLHASEFSRMLRNLFTNLEKDLADAWADWALGMGGSWKDMLAKMEREVLAFAFRMMVLKPIFRGLFGDLAVGPGGDLTGGTGLFGKALGALGFNIGVNAAGPVASSLSADMLSSGFPGMEAMISGIMHRGGIVGEGSTSRMVPSIVFANAARAHSGLMSDEVPIIAQRGESVLTAAQMKTLGSPRGDTYYIDARGADAAKIIQLESMIRSLNGSVERRAVSAVANQKLRGGTFAEVFR